MSTDEGRVGDSMERSDACTTSSAAPRCPGFVTALVVRCGQGDESALETLLELLYAPVRARLALADLPDDEVDELVGRAFVHIWHRAAAYDAAHPEGVVAWLLTEAGSVLTPTEPALVSS